MNTRPARLVCLNFEDRQIEVEFEMEGDMVLIENVYLAGTDVNVLLTSDQVGLLAAQIAANVGGWL